MDDDAGRERLIAETEAWFVHRGVPHFIEDYRATTDVFTRTLTPLTLVFLAEMFGALNLEWVWWANVLAVAGGFGLLLATWALVNRLRRRPPLARPDDVGSVELAVFVFVPAVLPLVFGGQVTSAVVTLAVNAGLLAAIYAVTSYGLVPMTRWALGQMFRQLSTVVGLLARALPLFLVFAAFLFVNAEVWQVGANFSGATFGVTVGLLLVVGLLFLFTRLPTEIGRLARFESDLDVRTHAADGPIADPPADLDPADLDPRTLSRRLRGNVVLVVVVSQGVQVVLASASIGLFFVAFGMFTITEPIIESWTTAPVVDPLATASLFGRDLVLTDTLLYVAGFLSAFAALYFTVQAVTDATYREQFFDEVVADVRQAFAVRVAYRALLGDGAGRQPSSGPLP